MPALLHRIKRLEALTDVRLTPCPTCGRLPNGGYASYPIRLVASFDAPEATHCPRCGAQTAYTLTLESPKDESA